DEVAQCAHAPSLAGQQERAIARALLSKPAWLSLDEATSATDEEEEAALYRTVANALPATTVISIGHRGSLEAFHCRVIAVDRVGRPGRVIDRAGDLVGVYSLVRQTVRP